MHLWLRAVTVTCSHVLRAVKVTCSYDYVQLGYVQSWLRAVRLRAVMVTCILPLNSRTSVTHAPYKSTHMHNVTCEKMNYS